jgi:hypothetical protein
MERKRKHTWAHRVDCRCEWCAAEAAMPTEEEVEPEFAPPKITCCESAIATGGAYHRPDCPR